MKFILFSILIFQNICSQTVDISLQKKEFIPGDIVMKNGDTVSGFIKDFTLPRTFEFQGLGFDFNSIESRLHLDRSKFTFRRELKSANENLDLDNIKSITLKEEADTTKFEKIKLKTVNANLEVIDLNREIMVPVIREGEINLYGARVYECSSTCTMMWVLAYIKKPNDEYAYIPIDMNRFNFMDMGNVDDKFLRVFQEIGSDCPAFLEYLETGKSQMANKNYFKESYAEYKNYQKEKKEKLKKIKGSKRKIEDDMDTEYFLKGYMKMIDEYSIRCN
ncbi:MAG TPA: hypothetical protein VF676_01415 [Flavobacterium sp.]|jgi:hypothetical protein